MEERCARFTPSPALFLIEMTKHEMRDETLQAMHCVNALILSQSHVQPERARMPVYSCRVDEFSPFACWKNAFHAG